MLIQEQQTPPQLSFRKIQGNQIHKLDSLFKYVRKIMNALTLFITEIIISLCLSGITLLVLKKPLKNILEDLCQTKKQSDFWVAYTRIMLSIAPLLWVLFFTKIYKYGTLTSVDSIYVIKASMIAALTGLLIGMLTVGHKVIIPASKKCSNFESK